MYFLVAVKIGVRFPGLVAGKGQAILASASAINPGRTWEYTSAAVANLDWPSVP